MKRTKRNHLLCIVLVFLILSTLIGCASVNTENESSQTPTRTVTGTTTQVPTEETKEISEPTITHANEVQLSDIPTYSNEAYISIFDNVPSFSNEDLSEISFEKYSPLDELGRCGVAFANIGKELMPEGERGGIGQIKPAGWHTVKYDGIDGLYLYNRCHLIGWQLSGENANELNLITGTRYLNVQGMLPLENMVADYVNSTENHVLYRVTPIYEGDNLLCKGIQIEAMSVEDKGKGICFNVFCYNVQPGIVIDYKTGDSYQEEKEVVAEPARETYILNTNTKKFHFPSCSSASDIKITNRKEFNGNRKEVIEAGYSPCGRCKP